MIILGKGEGQLANRLLISAHAIGYALSKQEILIDLSFSKYAKLFCSHISKSSTGIYFIKNHYLNLFLTIIMNILYSAGKRFNFLKIVDKYKIGWIHTEIKDLKRNKKSILYLEGEGFRDKKSVTHFKEKIKLIFSPNAKYKRIIDEISGLLKKEDCLLIGVHMRKGDYSNWLNGKYYFSDDIYKNALNQVREIFFNKKVKFLLCSDEKINKNKFVDFNVYISNQEAIVDLFLLSNCNYIIGPPSTFSLWAGYIGNVPIYHINKQHFKIQESEFAKIEL